MINILDYKGMVYGIAKRYHRTGVSFTDLIQQGWLGLVQAEQRFDESKGASFNTYAQFWVKREMSDYVRRPRFKEVVGYFEVDYLGVPFISPDETEHLISLLSGRPREIIIARYLEDKTLTELSKEYDLSVERIRQIESKGLINLRQHV
jgi:DNA-directed RNA polymerase sigma subunit (sigma70/sigma32)